MAGPAGFVAALLLPLQQALEGAATGSRAGAASPSRSTPEAGAPDLQALEQRLARLAQMLVLIARQVEVAATAIAPLLRDPTEPPP